MKIIEKFVSINGEGLKQGELSVFIRLMGCNLHCSYCDTLYSFINPVYKDESIDDIVSYIKKTNVKNVTITGGEPLIHEEVNELLIKLDKLGFNVEVETNGSVDVKKFYPNVSYTIDYKTPSSLMENKMCLENFKNVTKKDSVKFVCGDILDLEKSLEIMKKYDLINKTNCMISPVFNKIKLSDIVDFMIKNNLNNVKYSLQIHKYIWDPNLRGV